MVPVGCHLPGMLEGTSMEVVLGDWVLVCVVDLKLQAAAAKPVK